MTSRPVLVSLLCAMLAGPVSALAAASDPCRAAIAITERATFIPDRLMQAVAVMESGRRDGRGAVVPWPWTINVEGVGAMFDTKEAAIAAVRGHQARGARSIDVGCMQVNLMHHADAFASLEEAFDPAANARYAARFLQQLLAQTGSWPKAVAGYHSLTPDIGGDYAKKVLAIWAQPELGGQPAGPRPPAATMAGFSPVVGPVAAMPSLPSSAPARIIATPGSGGPMLTGRGLDSYRAMPTRLLSLARAS